MKKIGIIIKREYWTRVRKKSFLLTTILLPIGLSLLMALITYFTMKSESVKHIGVIDETGLYFDRLDKNNKKFALNLLTKDSTDLKSLAEKNKLDFIIQLFSSNKNTIDSALTFSENALGLSSQIFLEKELNKIYRKELLKQHGIDALKIDSIENQNLVVQNRNFENISSDSGMAAGLGYIMGFLMYMVIFIYGMSVMRGVSEEKTNRVAEVIVSSVKPFELMMGKIIGIALVGLTQLLIWVILMGALSTVLSTVFASTSNLADQGEILKQVNETSQNVDFKAVLDQLGRFNWPLIIFGFIFYFLGGYLIYAALFAAVGSLVNEDMQDSQQLTLPISLPIIFGFVILASSTNDPNNSLAVFGSIFPLTSPIVMVGRLPYHPPLLQLILSMLLLVGGFLLMVWLSSKIYRSGILMYGKKIGWKEALRWIRKS